jgi:hypothetical protein
MKCSRNVTAMMTTTTLTTLDSRSPSVSTPSAAVTFSGAMNRL